MIDDVVNSVINNVADKLGEATESMGPAIDSASAIAQTIVQETANTGFAYTMIGCACIGIGCISAISIIWALYRIKNDECARTTAGVLGIISFIFFVIGFQVAMINVGNWLAPTKDVALEIIRHL